MARFCANDELADLCRARTRRVAAWTFALALELSLAVAHTVAKFIPRATLLTRRIIFTLLFAAGAPMIDTPGANVGRTWVLVNFHHVVSLARRRGEPMVIACTTPWLRFAASTTTWKSIQLRLSESAMSIADGFDRAPFATGSLRQLAGHNRIELLRSSQIGLPEISRTTSSCHVNLAQRRR